MLLEQILPLLREGKKITHKTAFPAGYIEKYGTGSANETFILVSGKSINSFHLSHVPAEAIWDNQWEEYKELTPAEQ